MSNWKICDNNTVEIIIIFRRIELTYAYLKYPIHAKWKLKQIPMSRNQEFHIFHATYENISNQVHTSSRLRWNLF